MMVLRQGMAPIRCRGSRGWSVGAPSGRQGLRSVSRGSSGDEDRGKESKRQRERIFTEIWYGYKGKTHGD